MRWIVGRLAILAALGSGSGFAAGSDCQDTMKVGERPLRPTQGLCSGQYTASVTPDGAVVVAHGAKTCWRSGRWHIEPKAAPRLIFTPDELALWATDPATGTYRKQTVLAKKGDGPKFSRLTLTSDGALVLYDESHSSERSGVRFATPKGCEVAAQAMSEHLGEDNVDYDDSGCTLSDFQCPKEQQAIADHAAGRFQEGAAWLTASSAQVDSEIDAIRTLTSELLANELPGRIPTLKYRIELAEQRITKEVAPVESLLGKLGAKMSQNEQSEDYRRYHKFCFNLSGENYLRSYNLCGLHKLGAKFQRMAHKPGGERFQPIASFYQRLLAKYDGYEGDVAPQIAPFRDSNDRLLSIDVHAVRGTPSLWLDDTVAPFRRYERAVRRYKALADSLIIKLVELQETSRREQRIATESAQMEEHLRLQTEDLDGLQAAIAEREQQLKTMRNDLWLRRYDLRSATSSVMPAGVYRPLSREHHRLNSKNFLDQGFQPFKVPARARYVHITSQRPLRYKANGQWAKTPGTHPELLGQLTTPAGYRQLNPAPHELPEPRAPLGALFIRLADGRTVPVGEGRVVELPADTQGQTFGLMINDYQKGLSQEDCPDPKQGEAPCFVLQGDSALVQAQYYEVKDEAKAQDFAKVLSFIDTTLRFYIDAVSYERYSYATAHKMVLKAIGELVADRFSYMPMVEHAMATALLERKLHHQQGALARIKRQHALLAAEVQAVAATREGLAAALAAGDDELRKAVSVRFFARRFALEKELLQRAMQDLSVPLTRYGDTVTHREPARSWQNSRFEKIQEARSSLLKQLAAKPSKRSRTQLCHALRFITPSAEKLCIESDDSIQVDAIKDAFARFLEPKDQEWRKPPELHNKKLRHCNIEFSNYDGIGTRYMRRHFGVEKIEELFKKDGERSSFFVAKDFDSPRFRTEDACQFVNASARKECRLNDDYAKVVLEELEGYYELPLRIGTNLIHAKDQNLECGFLTKTRDALRSVYDPTILGAAMEWRSTNAFDLFNSTFSRVSLTKSTASWYDEGIVEETSGAFSKRRTFSQMSGVARLSSRLPTFNVRLMESNYLENAKHEKLGCPSYETPECALKLLGQDVSPDGSTGVYPFKKSFFGSWSSSDWVLRIPIFSGTGRKSYHRKMVEYLKVLRLHFYYLEDTGLTQSLE